jgi:hypothetical protein
LVLSFFDPSLDNYPQFVQMLQARGYQVVSGNTVDLRTLRAMPTNLGLCYIFTHVNDTILPVTDQNPTPAIQFGLTTSQVVGDPTLTATDQALIQADVTAGRLVPAPATNQYSRVGTTVTTTETNVCVATAAFFNHYWKGKQIFSQNSLVFINGCFSADPGFQAILTGCGAGLVLGWDWPTDARDAASTAAFVFDRMLGTNLQNTFFNPDLTRQRPMTWDQVSVNMPLYQSMIGNPLGTSNYSLGSLSGPSKFSALTNSQVMLVPSITGLGPVEYTKKLYVNGNFGSTQLNAIVMLLESPDSGSGGNPAPIQSWSSNMITADLPSSAGSSQAGGYVLVSFDTRTSNCVPLTVFSGWVVITRTGNGSLQEVITEECYLRLDGHVKRYDFSQKTSPACYLLIEYTADLSADSTLTYQASGKYVGTGNDNTTRTLSGSGTIPPFTAVTGQAASSQSQYFDINIEFTPHPDNLIRETHDVTISPSFSQGLVDNSTVVLTSSDSSGNSSSSNIPAFDIGVAPFSNVNITPSDPSSYDLPDPETQLSNMGGTLNAAKLSVQLQVEYPPDSSKGEDYLSVMGSP